VVDGKSASLQNVAQRILAKWSIEVKPKPRKDMTYGDFDIDIGNKISGQVYTTCPQCSHDRRKKSVKCLGVNLDKGIWHCNHCDWSGSLHKKKYILPRWENITTLSDKVLEWFQTRNISQETLIKMQVSETKEFMPQVEAERTVIAFPYIQAGKVVNVKYRTSDKHFKMAKDAELIFYNLDGLKDQEEAIIVEGEIDALTMIQIGFTNTVSVPNGASKGNNNLQYLDNCYQYFDAVKKVIIATDNDEPGEKLAGELARRIGIEKCFRAKFGEFKDVNEIYCKTGKVTFTSIDPFPIEGIFGVQDHWEGLMTILKTGFPKGWKPRGKIGECLSIHPGYTTIITGVPGHGKSEVLDQILLQLCLDYNLRGGFFTPENRPTEVHIIKLIEKLLGKSIWKTEVNILNRAKEFLFDRIFWIYPNEGYDLDSILDKVRQAVLRYGVNWFVLDPWNKLEHQYTQSETKYISESLDKIANFNHKNGTHAFVVAHPTKMRFNHDQGCYEIPGLYDISGSANFYNKADIGLTMYKNGENKNTLYVQKVKFKYWGQNGSIELNWNPDNGRYDEYGFDPTSWLDPIRKNETIDFTEPKEEPMPF
jgi:twinkle protein